MPKSLKGAIKSDKDGVEYSATANIQSGLLHLTIAPALRASENDLVTIRTDELPDVPSDFNCPFAQSDVISTVLIPVSGSLIALFKSATSSVNSV